MIYAGIALLAMTGTQSLRADSTRRGINSEEARRLEEQNENLSELKRTGSAEYWFESGKRNMEDFNFAQAKKDFTEYRRLTKNKNSEYADEVNTMLEGINEGLQQFERFRDIVVIDAYTVPRSNFIRNLRLPLSAGRIIGGEELPKSPDVAGMAGYMSEGGDLMIWSQISKPQQGESEGSVNLVEATRLVDGSMSEAKIYPELGEDPDYPFLTADGMTLYFSSPGANSVGGRDIFISTRDPQTGEFRQPVNAGFPFNSEADDYLLAIDEENGVGWWATDRHHLQNDIVLYVFLLPDGRRNFEGTDEEKRQRGVLDDVRVTWTSIEPADDFPEDTEDDEEEMTPEKKAELLAARERSYEEKAAEIRKIKPGQRPQKKECVIPRKGGGFIYSEEDVKTQAEKQLVKLYTEENKEYEGMKNELSKKRRQYSRNPNHSLGNEIADLEKRTDEKRIRLISILSELYKELGQN